MEIYAGFLSHTDHHGSAAGRDRAAGGHGRHARLCDRRRQRRPAEGTLQGSFNEMINFNAMAALDARVMAGAAGQVRRPESYNHYAVGWAWAMDTPSSGTKQVASHWGRDPQRHHRPLAQGHPGQGRAALAVLSRHRHRPHGAGGGRHSGADDGPRRHPKPYEGTSMVRVSCRERSRAARPAVLRDVRQPRHLLPGLERGHQAPHAVAPRGGRAARSTTTSGSCTTAAVRLQPGPTTWPGSTPTDRTSCSGCG